jgi:hypothetical protein
VKNSNPCPEMKTIHQTTKNNLMETQFLFGKQLSGHYQDIQLRFLAGKLINGIQPAAVRQNSFIVNDISPAIMVTTDENLLATVINDLLAVIVSRNKNSCIRLTAKSFTNLVLLHIQDQNKTIRETTLNDFDGLQPLASKVGGCITINNRKKESATLVLSMLDFASVA